MMARDGYRIFDSDTHVGPDAAILERYLSQGEKNRLAGWEEYRATGRSGQVTYTKGQRSYRRKLGAAKPDETVGEKIDDASITAQVKMSLLSHRSTSALKTKVETTDGVVTLTGVTKNAAEKALVTKLVTDVNGVSSVVNNMTIGTALSKS
jgi:osmotically-inducible protein OsmY